MTDKEKFHKEVEKLKSNLIYGACSSQIAMETMCKEEAYNEVLALLDTMQEEPVSEKKCMFTKDNYTDNDRKVLCADCDEKCEYSKKEEPVSVWHDSSEMPTKGKIILVVQNNGFPFVCDVRNDIGYVSLSFDHRNKTKINGNDKWAYIDDLLKM